MAASAPSWTDAPRIALRFSLIFVLLGALSALPAQRLAGAKAAFDVPADSAERSLKKFSAQSGIDVIFVPEAVINVTTKAIKGEFTPGDAIRHMLAGTTLVAEQDERTGTLRVLRNSDPNVPRAAPKTSDRPGVPSDRMVAAAAAARPATNGDALASETVQLSPFEVTAEEDSGYKATSTLAGTRLRSDLKDLAASITVITKDFMNDVNATDMESLLVYTLGTEVGGYSGNFSDLSNPEANGVFDDALGQPNPGTRIRGLTGGDTTRNYFQSDVPMDSYNADRIEINRGANANLFGLGSPSGIINTGMISADLRRAKTSVSAAFGSYGSYRATFDHSHPLIKDKLSFRTATVFDNQRFRIEHALKKKKAITLSATFQPLKNTKVKITSEFGRTDSNNPEIRPPFDSFSWWFAAGKPVYNPTTSTTRFLGTPQAPFTNSGVPTVVSATGARNSTFLASGIGGWVSDRAGIFYLDPNSSAIGGLDIGGGRTVGGVKGFATNGGLNLAGNALATSGMASLGEWGLIRQNVHEAGNPLASLYNRRPQITDPRIFDFYHEMIGGPTKYEWNKYETHNVTLEHTFLNRNAGIEVGFDKQRMDSGFTSPVDYRLNLDINEVLPNGAPNPNFLRPVIGSTGFKRVYTNDRDQYRASGYYSLDLRKTGPNWLGKLLGQHRIQSTYTGNRRFTEKHGGFMWYNTNDYLVSEGKPTPGTAAGDRIVSIVSYLGPSIGANATSPSDYRAQGFDAGHDPTGVPTFNLLYNKRVTATTRPADWTPERYWSPATFNLLTNGREDVKATIQPSGGLADRKETKANSLSFALQDRWLGDSVITTAGWRQDKVRNYDAGIAPRSAVTGQADIDWDLWHPELVRQHSASKTNWGVVGHLPKFIQRRLPWDTEGSVFYNSASNFRVADQRYSLSGESLPSETGETKEYGIRFSTFNGRLDFRVARFETVADKATVNGLVVALNQLCNLASHVVERNYAGDNRNNPQGIRDFEAWLESPQGLIFRNAFNVDLIPNNDPGKPASEFGRYADATGSRGQVIGVSALKATGTEFEVTFNPLRNWRMTGSFSKSDVVRTNIAPDLRDFLFNPTTGLVNTLGPGKPFGDLLGGNSASNSVRLFLNSSVLNNGLITTFATEGTKSDELRNWDFRGTTNYSFTGEQFGGKLRGISMGGSVRFADKPILGYGGKIIPNGGVDLVVSDVAQPIFGPNDPTFDAYLAYSRKLGRKIGWKVQLYVKNVAVGNELIPIQALPNGQAYTYRIREPQKWTVTNTLTF